MTNYLIRATPGEAWYCVWSTVVDAPVAYGSKDDILRHRFYSFPSGAWARADASGSSSPSGEWYTWEDETFMVRECGLPEARDLKRSDLKAFCMLMDADDVPGMMALTTPIEGATDD